MELQQQQLQRDIEAFTKQHEEHKHHQQQQQQQQQQLQSTAEALLAAAYEQQIRAAVQQCDYDREMLVTSLKTAHKSYDGQKTSDPNNALDSVDGCMVYNNNNNNNNSKNSTNLPVKVYTSTPAHLQRPSSFELTPSPSGSASSPPLPALNQISGNDNSGSGPNTANGNSTGSGTDSGNNTPNLNQQQQQQEQPSNYDEPSNNRLLKCSLCDYTTLYRSHLEDHEVEEHCNAKFYRCEKCSYVTHIKARFSKHVKYHSMPMIKCVTCDFRTPYKWNLDRHMKNHGGTGPFKCAACDFTADIKQSLTVHEMNHHVPPVGHAAGMSLGRRRNKVGGTDIGDDFFSDSGEMIEDHYNNNHMDEYDELLLYGGGGGAPNDGAYGKRARCENDEEPTDLSQKIASSESDVSLDNHQQQRIECSPSKITTNAITTTTTTATSSAVSVSRNGNGSGTNVATSPMPINKEGENILNLSKDISSLSRSSLTEIASMFFSEKQISEMLDKSNAFLHLAANTSRLSPSPTIQSNGSNSNRTPAQTGKKSGGFFDKLKSSSTTNENLICSCGHIAKCLSESIIHRKNCTCIQTTNGSNGGNNHLLQHLNGYDQDDEDDEDDEFDHDNSEGRLEIDFNANDNDDQLERQSQSALNLSVTGSTRCQHCRHRCKSSADLLNHLKNCNEASNRLYGTEHSFDSMSTESFYAGSRTTVNTASSNCSDTNLQLQHPMENKVFIWNKLPSANNLPGGSIGNLMNGNNGHNNNNFKSRAERSNGGSTGHVPFNNSLTNNSGIILSNKSEENSYYGVETAPGYGEVRNNHQTGCFIVSMDCFRKIISVIFL